MHHHLPPQLCLDHSRGLHRLRNHQLPERHDEKHHQSILHPDAGHIIRPSYQTHFVEEQNEVNSKGDKERQEAEVVEVSGQVIL